MDKEYVKNNYILPNYNTEELKNPTGLEYVYSPFGVNHGETFLINYENTKLPLSANNSVPIIGGIFNNTVALDPRPSILIGKNHRN